MAFEIVAGPVFAVTGNRMAQNLAAKTEERLKKIHAFSIRDDRPSTLHR